MGKNKPGPKPVFSDKYHVEARRRRKESYHRCKAKPKQKPKPNLSEEIPKQEPAPRKEEEGPRKDETEEETIDITKLLFEDI